MQWKIFVLTFCLLLIERNLFWGEDLGSYVERKAFEIQDHRKILYDQWLEGIWPTPNEVHPQTEEVAVVLNRVGSMLDGLSRRAEKAGGSLWVPLSLIEVYGSSLEEVSSSMGACSVPIESLRDFASRGESSSDTEEKLWNYDQADKYIPQIIGCLGDLKKALEQLEDKVKTLARSARTKKPRETKR